MPEGECLFSTPLLRSVFLCCLLYYLYAAWLCVVWPTLLLSQYVRLRICEKRLGSDRVSSVEFLWEDVWCCEERLLRFCRILWSSVSVFVCDYHVCATIMVHLLSSATVCLPSPALFLTCFWSAIFHVLCVTCSLFLSVENSVLGSVYTSVPSRSQLYGSLPVSSNVYFSCTPPKLSIFFLFLILW